MAQIHASAPSAAVVGPLVVLLLTELAQHAFAQAGHSHQWFGALHAMDGSIILLLSAWLTVLAVRRLRR